MVWRCDDLFFLFFIFILILIYFISRFSLPLSPFLPLSSLSILSLSLSHSHFSVYYLFLFISHYLSLSCSHLILSFSPSPLVYLHSARLLFSRKRSLLGWGGQGSFAFHQHVGHSSSILATWGLFCYVRRYSRGTWCKTIKCHYSPFLINVIIGSILVGEVQWIPFVSSWGPAQQIQSR
jgi:hypothetical protein